MHLSPIEINELCLAIICLFNLGLGILVLLRQPTRLVNRAFALVALSICMWGSGLIMISRTHNFSWNTFILFGFVFILYSLVLFARVFPSVERISWKFCFYAALAPLSIVILAPFKLIIQAGVFREGTNPEPINGPLYPLFLIVSATYVAASLYLFIRTLRRSRGQAREQMRYFIFGLSAFALCAFIFDIFLPSIGIFELNFLGPISSIILTGTTAYAIIRHNLLDIRVVIQRSIVYTLLFALVAGLYVGILGIAGYFLHELTSLQSIVSAGITTLIGVFSLRPLETYFQKLTDPIFFKDKYNYAEALYSLSKILYTSLDENDIITRAEATLQNIFKTNAARIILDPAAVAHLSEEGRSAGFTTLSHPMIFEDKALGVLSLCMWGSGLIMISRTHNFSWNTFILFGFVFILYSLVLFARVFPSVERISWKFCFYAALAPLSIVILAPFKLIIQAGVFREGTNPEPINGPLYPLFLIVSATYVAASLYLFIRTLRRSRGQAREQMRYFIFGLSAFALCAFIFDIFLPSIGIFELNFLGPISSIILTGTTAYAIIRHNLLDIRVVIQRSIVYTLLFALVAGLYVGILGIAGYFLHELTSLQSIVSAGITTLIGVFSLRPLETYFQKLTDPIFFKDKYNYAEALYSLSKILYTSLDENDIITRAEATLQNIFKTNAARIILDPAAVAHLSEEGRSAGFTTLSHPMIFEDKALGVLSLGAKRSGDSYTKQDLQLISTFAFHCTIGIQKARLHQEVREHSVHLEHLVEERTSEIKTLQEEQKQAMIDISHNLQTPLAIIRGELEPLGEDDGESEKMEVVRKSIDRVSGFIRQLLRIARFEHSIEKIELAKLDISALLKEQADYFEVMAEDKDVEIRTALPAQVAVLGNKRLLEELFMNLVANAIRYRSLDRASFIEISLKESEPEGKILVSIRDNGIGIKPEDMPKLFERFYRAINDAAKPQGTGVGLAIVKQITEAHGGTVEVMSTLDEGTEFIVTLPQLEKNTS